jgi:hypothetical protein
VQLFPPALVVEVLEFPGISPFAWSLEFDETHEGMAADSSGIVDRADAAFRTTRC